MFIFSLKTGRVLIKKILLNGLHFTAYTSFNTITFIMNVSYTIVLYIYSAVRSLGWILHVRTYVCVWTWLCACFVNWFVIGALIIQIYTKFLMLQTFWRIRSTAMSNCMKSNKWWHLMPFTWFYVFSLLDLHQNMDKP